MKKTVALIFGGEGYEHSISLQSAESLAEMIDRKKYSVLCVGISKTGEWYIYNGKKDKIGNGEWIYDKSHLTPTYPVKLCGESGFLKGGEIIPVHTAIPCLHGDFGEDGVIQGALDTAHICYVGEDVYSSAVTIDKSYTKLIAEKLGIPTAKWILSTNETFKEAKERAEKIIGYPMFIKPTRLGSSYGASPVYTESDFEEAFRCAKAYSERLIIEELIRADYELECAVLNTDKRYIVPFGRIHSHGSFYDFFAKYEGENSPKTEASDNGGETEKRVYKYAKKLADFIDVRQLCRIDFFVTEKRDVYFNEINAFPGMTKNSLYPVLTELVGLKKGDFINLLIEKAHTDDRRI